MQDNKEVFENVIELKPVLWENRNCIDAKSGIQSIGIDSKSVYEAEDRLLRFSSLIKKLFPETLDGIIESPLVEISNMKKAMENFYGTRISGKMFLKCDSELKIAGSVKARGGIYEVLKHAEDIALASGSFSIEEDYSILLSESYRNVFSSYKIAVGSTGNLGLSIGIMSSALGFNVTVHMSRDAKKWKKDLLRSKGVTVIEYDEDYSKAVEQGRKQCLGDPKAYFIDDENSIDLFLGYSVAALRLKSQLQQQGVIIDERHKLKLYLPCGVGGAPGGITFGAKLLFGNNVKCYFVEPTHSPSMLLGLLTGKHNKLHVSDYTIDNITEADGLAVGSPSKLSSMVADKLMDGEYTMLDEEMFKLLALLKDSEGRKLEVSAASSLMGPTIVEAGDDSIHICWATGGLLLPDQEYINAYEIGKHYLHGN
jgi:D-serine dehydratase